MMSKKNIFSIGGIVLCLLFFVVPLVKCSADSSINASGFQIASGTGDLMSEAGKSYPFVFLLIVAPVALAVMGFTKKSFAMLRNVSVAGLAFKIIFMITAYVMLSGDDFKDAFGLTGFNWFIILLYSGLAGFAQYCIKTDSSG